VNTITATPEILKKVVEISIKYLLIDQTMYDKSPKNIPDIRKSTEVVKMSILSEFQPY